MTAQPHASAFQSGGDTESFHVLRSKLIDEFARLELAVNKCLLALGRTPDARKTTLSYRITELSRQKPAAKLSEVDAGTLVDLPQTCEPLQRLRSSIVHGAMELASHKGEAIALFRNVADIVGNEFVCHALTRSDFRQSLAAMRSTTESVEACLKRLKSAAPRSSPGT